jgi:hypothetical protein
MGIQFWYIRIEPERLKVRLMSVRDSMANWNMSGNKRICQRNLRVFMKKITNLIVVRRQIYWSVFDILKYGHFNYTVLNIFCLSSTFMFI